jgi:hypothetical protein
METKNYAFGIAVYSDDLYPDDYVDGQENTYYLTEEQYKNFYKQNFDCAFDMHNWLVENLDKSDIYLVDEFVNGIADIDQGVFDFHKQKCILR